jgi:hypothetical protein
MINSKSIRYIFYGALLALVCIAGACLESTPASKSKESGLPSVSEPPRIKPPTIITFEVSPTKVTVVEPVMIRWEVSGADSINIDQGIGKIPPTGTKKLAPTQSAIYKLTASNAGGENSRTVAITVYDNTNASKIALNDDDVKSTGFSYRRNAEPSVSDTISTYSVTFTRRGVVSSEEMLDNTIFIYNTVAAMEKRYIETKANAKGNLPNIIVVGDEGYILKIPGMDLNETATYAIRFRKNNVFVNIGTISNLKELESFARIIESRIK